MRMMSSTGMTMASSTIVWARSSRHRRRSILDARDLLDDLVEDTGYARPQSFNRDHRHDCDEGRDDGVLDHGLAGLSADPSQQPRYRLRVHRHVSTSLLCLALGG